MPFAIPGQCCNNWAIKPTTRRWWECESKMNQDHVFQWDKLWNIGHIKAYSNPSIILTKGCVFCPADSPQPPPFCLEKLKICHLITNVTRFLYFLGEHTMVLPPQLLGPWQHFEHFLVLKICIVSAMRPIARLPTKGYLFRRAKMSL